jgi:hypothetical protein
VVAVIKAMSLGLGLIQIRSASMDSFSTRITVTTAAARSQHIQRWGSSEGVETMETFRLTADFYLEAEGIDDAFRRLAAHFQALERGVDSDLMIGGSIEIRPISSSNNRHEYEKTDQSQ